MCFEGISELAATEIEEEPLWDGQAKSSRYQDFSRSGFVTPPEFRDADAAAAYRTAGEALLEAYRQVKELAFAAPGGAPAAARGYEARRLPAQPGGAGLRRGALPAVLGRAHQRGPGDQHPHAGKADPPPGGLRIRRIAGAGARRWPRPAPPRRIARGTPPASAEPLAPTLARHAEADEHAARARRDLRLWAAQNLPARPRTTQPRRAWICCGPRTSPPISWPRCSIRSPTGRSASCTRWPAVGASAPRAEVIDVALASRTSRDEILAGFRGGLYATTWPSISGAYRDLHRHRRCQKFRQDYSGRLGFETPALVDGIGRGRSLRFGHAPGFRRHAPAAGSRAAIICCPSARARASSSRWISPRPNTSRGCAAA